MAAMGSTESMPHFSRTKFIKIGKLISLIGCKMVELALASSAVGYL